MNQRNISACIKIDGKLSKSQKLKIADQYKSTVLEAKGNWSFGVPTAAEVAYTVDGKEIQFQLEDQKTRLFGRKFHLCEDGQELNLYACVTLCYSKARHQPIYNYTVSATMLESKGDAS